jgi:cytochrome c oxidase subunit II
MPEQRDPRVEIVIRWMLGMRIAAALAHQVLLPLTVVVAIVPAAAAPLSTLDAAGPGAAAIADIWWVMFWGSLVIFVIVSALAVYPFLKSRNVQNVPTGPFLWGGGLAFPLVVLAILMAYAFAQGQAMVTGRGDGFRVEVHAHQWWWEFVYPDAEGGPIYTAFALHVPAGEDVNYRIASDNVIHSFWVPRLGRKVDATPGLVTSVTLRADTPGVYWGQCSEFCGMQHAAMAFTVEAHERADFAATLAALVAATPDPTHPGAPDFATNCAACHSADARQRGNGAPNLAGLATRSHLGSGAFPLTGPEDLSRWLREHHVLKPRSLKPDHADIDDAVLDRIVSYLMQ